MGQPELVMKFLTVLGAPLNVEDFSEMSCSHFPWKSKDENLQTVSPKFRQSL